MSFAFKTVSRLHYKNKIFRAFILEIKQDNVTMTTIKKNIKSHSE